MSSGGLPVVRKFLTSLCPIRAAPGFRRSFLTRAPSTGGDQRRTTLGKEGAQSREPGMHLCFRPEDESVYRGIGFDRTSLFRPADSLRF